MTNATHSPAAGLRLEVVGMSKRFGPLVAFERASMKVREGSFHALLGENGAGKSTLVKCIMGYYAADEGQLIVGEREEDIRSPRQAHALGLGMVYQHFTLVPNMSVAENLVLVRDHIPALIDWKRERARLEEFIARMPFAIPLDAMAGSLAAGEKQKIEILKQLYLGRRFLILDEPTSVLTPAEADEILGLLRDMTRAQKLTVLMITHKFREVTKFADEVTILRRGRIVGGGSVGSLGIDQMAKLMIGADAPPKMAARRVAAGKPRLELIDLDVENDSLHPAVRRANLVVRSREIVGIAGVAGNGQRELVEVLAGQREPRAGEVRVHGVAYRASRAEMRRHKVFCLTEEPLRSACVARMSVAENLALRKFDRAPFANAGWLNRSAFDAAARNLIARYRIRPPDPDARMATLSGGNVQRTVLARELSGDVEVLVAANPCFGLDFAATLEIRTQIVDVRNRGAAVLLVSEDLDELLELSDRVVVMFNGAFVHECPAAGADPVAIGGYMAGWFLDDDASHADDRRQAVSV
jgi:general nucleoside transport system ATP-binding protein